MSGVVILDLFWQQTFAAALTPTRKSGAAAFGFHPSSKAVLAFTRALRWLVSAFHLAPVKWTGKVEITFPLSMAVVEAAGDKWRRALPRAQDAVRAGLALKRVPSESWQKTLSCHCIVFR